MRTSHLLAVSAGVLLVAPLADAAELNGQIRGVVVDEGGLPIPGAAVTVSSPNMIGDRSSTTDPEGRYRAPALPTGAYALLVEKPGFNSYRAEDLRIAPGGVLTLEVTLELAGDGETIVVTDDRPIVDVQKAQTGVNLTASQMKDLPIDGRDYQSAMSVAPGVVGGGNPNMHGGFDSSNQYFIDGVNTTDPLTNTFSTNMNFDAIQEVQVITGGMDAEYGQSLGGAVNVVTKSGGNEYEAQATVTYSDQNFEVYEPLEGEDPDAAQYTSQTYALNVGGPVIKDQLWFFTSLQMDIYRDALKLDPGFERPTGLDPITGDEMSTVAPRDWRSYYAFGKLTWQPTSEHRVWVHAQADPTIIKNVEQNEYTLPSAESIQTQGGWLGSVGHLWMPSEQANLETQVYYQTTYLDYYSILWDDCGSFDDRGACTDDFGDAWIGSYSGDFSYGELPYASFNDRDRASLNSAYTRYVNLLGSHELKVGGQLEWLQSYYIYPGLEEGIEYWTSTGDPTDLDTYVPDAILRYDNDLEVTLTTTLYSGYVQDVWQPIPTVTLRPGLRIDHAQLRNDQGEGVLTTTDLQPRLGFAWDLFGDQTTNLHAYYGRFAQPGYLAIADLLKTKSEGYGYYSATFDEETGDFTGWSDTPLFAFGGTFLQGDNLKSPYSDEFNVGFTRAITENASLDVTWIHEVARNFWEDDEVNLIWDETGSEVIGNRNGTNEAIYRLTTSDDLYTRYNSIETTVSAQLDKWWTQMSYTWSEATGTSDDHVATLIWDIPEQRQYYEGYLAYDVTHFVKVHGVYTEEDVWSVGRGSAGYLAGWAFNFRSGDPYRRYYYNSYYDDWLNYQEASDGTYRLPAFAQLDLRAGLGLDAGPTRWSFILDCLNVFNSRTVTSVDETWGDVDGEGVYLDDNGEPYFGQPTSRQDPRRFVLTLRGEF